MYYEIMDLCFRPAKRGGGFYWDRVHYWDDQASHDADEPPTMTDSRDIGGDYPTHRRVVRDASRRKLSTEGIYYSRNALLLYKHMNSRAEPDWEYEEYDFNLPAYMKKKIHEHIAVRDATLATGRRFPIMGAESRPANAVDVDPWGGLARPDIAALLGHKADTDAEHDALYAEPRVLGIPRRLTAEQKAAWDKAHDPDQLRAAVRELLP